MMSHPVPHIVIDARFWRRSAAGLSTYSRQLVHHLAALDRTQRYTLLITPADVPEFDVIAPNVRALVVPIEHYSLAEQLKLPRILATLQPDLVHFLHFNHPLGYQGKFVVTMHDLTVVYWPVGRQQRNPLRRLAFLTVMKDAARRASRVIAVSRSTKADLVRDLGADPERVSVIYEGLTLAATRAQSAAALAPFGIRAPYLLFVSQWRPHKRIEDLVAAFERLAPEHPVLTLVLAGQPNELFPATIARVEHSPFRHRIVTPGFVPDALLPTLYARAELFIFPSLYEGFGLPPLEAMACGTPVVAARASCLPETLGSAAAFFKPGDVEALTRTVRRLLEHSDERRALTRVGKAQAAQYDWERTARETLDVYRTVLGQ